MNDHELDDQIRRLAESYNEPPVTPRDAMWARIEQGRGGSTHAAIDSGRRIHWLRMSAGIAAVLVVGIGIGRLTSAVGTDAAGGSVASSSSPDGDAVRRRDIPVLANVGESNDALASSDAPDPAAVGGDEGARFAETGAAATNRVRATRAQRIAALSAERRAEAREASRYGVQRSGPASSGDAGGMSSHQLAVVEHMARSELLLTSFLAESRNPNDARTVAQFAVLSRDLLKTTRLLLATRTSEDPALTRLLEDLELVLMQISQYTSEGRRGDLDAINQSLERRNVLPKLRSNIPAGASASTGI
jgi:hypothetical protein